MDTRTGAGRRDPRAAGQDSTRRRRGPAAGRGDRPLLAELKGREAELRALQGESPLVHAGRQLAGDRRNRRRLDRHSGRPDDGRRDQHGAEPEVADGTADRRPIARPRAHRPVDPHVPRQPDRSAHADRRVPAGRHQRRRQDRDGHRAGRAALRRRAEHDRHQHVGVQGGAQGLAADGLAAGLRRLRRRAAC